MSLFGSLIPGFGLSGALGGLLKNPKDAQGAALAKLFAQLEGQRTQDYGEAERQNKLGLRDINTGFDNAIANAGRGATVAKQDVNALNTQQLGQTQQGLIDSGLGNTTAGANATRGVYADTARRLNEINGNLASTMSGLQIGKAGAVAGQRAKLAGMFQDRQQAGAGLGLGYGNLIANHQKPKNPLAKILGGFAGSLVGSAF